MTHVPDDELLSALLDNEQAPGDVAHVDTCPECQARLAQLRAAATAVATPVALPAGHVREAALAAALHPQAEPRRRVTAGRRMNALSAAAVLVVALGVGSLAIGQIGGNKADRLDSNAALTQNDAATTADAAASGGALRSAQNKFADNSAVPGAASSGGSGGDSSTTEPMETSSAPAETDLGRVDDISVVSKRSTNDIAEREATVAGSATTAPLPCPPDATDEPVVWHASLNYQGTDAVATVRTHTATTRITEIRARADCSLLASQEFEPTTPH